MNMEGVTLGAVILLLIKEVITSFSSSYKDNAKATKENTIALTRLQVELEHLRKGIDMIPKMKEDIDNAHNKIRALSGAGGKS